MSPEDKLFLDEREQRYKEKFDALSNLWSERELRYTERAKAQQTAVDKAEQQALRWMENANEWRAQSKDREQTFAQKTEVDIITHRMDRTEGRSIGIGSLGGTVKDLAVIALAIIAILVSLRK